MMARSITRSRDLRLESLAHEGSALVIDVRGNATEHDLDRFSAGVLSVYGGDILTLRVVNNGAGWTYEFKPSEPTEASA